MASYTKIKTKEESDDDAPSLDSVINSFGFTRFSFILMLIIGALWMSESCETNLMSLIGPQFRCVWNLSSLQTSLTSSTVFLGNGFGAIVFGYYADVYGRKYTMIVGAMLSVYFGLLCAVSPNFKWFLVLRFFVGVGMGPVQLGPCYISELITKKHRGKSVISVDLFYAVGSIYIALMALWLMQAQGWRVFILVSSIPASFFLLLSPWLPESVRYLQQTGNITEIMRILHRISVVSGKPIPRDLCIENVCKTSMRGDVRILFTKKHRTKLFIVTMLFIASMWSYFAIALINTENLQSHAEFCRYNDRNNSVYHRMTTCTELTTKDYLQNMLVVTAEIPGILLPALIVDWLGRKSYTITALIITGLGFLSLNVCLTRTYATVIMYLMRFTATGLAQMPFLFTSELFPTVVRGTALGIAMGVCKLSLFGVPFLVQYFLHISYLGTTIIFGALCFGTAVLVLFLPEMKGKSLEDV